METLLILGLWLVVIGGSWALGRRFLPAVMPVLLAGMLLGLGIAPILPGLAMASALAAPQPAATSNGGDNGTSAAPAPMEENLPANGGSADAGDIPSETVSRFVEAYLAVVELIDSKEASLQRAETDAESRQMQEEIQREALGLIQDHDLTLQAYWELLGLANSDAEFRERVLAQVEEASL